MTTIDGFFSGLVRKRGNHHQPVLMPIGTVGPPVMDAIMLTLVVGGVVLRDAAILPATIGRPFYAQPEGAEAEFTPFDEASSLRQVYTTRFSS